MKKIDNIIEGMNKEELIELKEFLEQGTIKYTIQKKLERFKNLNNVCPVCNTQVGDEDLTLIFGPPDMRKKAVFDGTDCLEYFLTKIRK